MTAQGIAAAPDAAGLSAQRWRNIAIACCALMAVGAAVGIMTPAGLGWDFANFYDTGRRAAAGQIQNIYDPATSIGGLSPQGNMAFWGAPISAWFYAPLSWFSSEVALAVFKLIGTLAYAVGLVLLYRHLRTRVDAEPETQQRFAALFALTALLYQPFWTMYRVGGQTTPLVFLLLVAGLLAYERDRPVLTAVMLLFAVLIKPAFLLVVVLLCAVSGWRFLLTTGAVFGAAGLLSIALVGWPLHQEFIQVLVKGSQRPAPWFFNSSLYILADALRPIQDSAPVPGAGGPLPDLLRTGMKVLVLALFAWLVVQSRREAWSPVVRRQFTFLLAVGFGLLLSQVVWEHYLAVLFLPLAALLAAGTVLSQAARRHLAAIVVFALAQNLILVMFFRAHVPIRSTPALLAVSLVKSGTLLLYLWWLISYRQQLFGWYGRQGDPTDMRLAASGAAS